MKTKMLSQQGFSLIELLVVVLIGITLTTVALFSFVGTRRNIKTVTNANIVASFMQQARQTAIATRKYQIMTIQRNADSSGKINCVTISTPKTLALGAPIDVIRKEYLAQDVVLARPTNVALTSTGPREDAFQTAPFTSTNLVTIYFNVDGSVTSGAAFPASGSNSFSNSIFFADAPSGPGTSSPAPELTRVISISGPSGGVKFWSYAAGQYQTGSKNF